MTYNDPSFAMLRWRMMTSQRILLRCTLGVCAEPEEIIADDITRSGCGDVFNKEPLSADDRIFSLCMTQPVNAVCEGGRPKMLSLSSGWQGYSPHVCAAG